MEGSKQKYIMIKELNKYSEQLIRFRENNALPQGDVKNALADIYEANWEKNKKWGASKIKRGCPSCISDMMKSLTAYFYDNNLVEHRFPKEETFKDLSWAELKTYAKDKGVKTYKKTREEIESELNG